MSQIARAEGPDALAGVVDPVWTRLRQDAEAVIRQEPAMTASWSPPSLTTRRWNPRWCIGWRHGSDMQ